MKSSCRRKKLSRNLSTVLPEIYLNMREIKIFLKNFGCKTNFADLFSLIGRITEHAEIEISDFSDSELVVLNSCSVTQDAERELIKWIRKAKKSGKKVLVSGCMPNLKGENILRSGADATLGAGKYTGENVASIFSVLFGLNPPDAKNGNGRAFVISNPKDVSPELEDDAEHFSRSLHLFPRHRIYLKIQEGCDRFCTFCSIPLTRGLPRSLSPRVITEKIKRFADSGFREIVLVGTHLALYRKEGISFGGLVKFIAKELRDYAGTIRIRFASLSPGEIDDDFIEGLTRARELFCPHFHISVQSGSDRILKLMRRWHTFDDFMHDAQKLLSIYPSACIGTDIIVGFPGETDGDFRITLSNLQSAPVGHIHVFPFSPRPKTPAGLMKPVPSSVVKERVDEMLSLAFEKRKGFVENSISGKFNLLVERIEENGIFGTTENYINCIITKKEDLKKEELNRKSLKEGDLIPVVLKGILVDERKGKISAISEPLLSF